MDSTYHWLVVVLPCAPAAGHSRQARQLVVVAGPAPYGVHNAMATTTRTNAKPVLINNKPLLLAGVAFQLSTLRLYCTE